mmetsp:Transcript_28933/g.96369  ORF Transcript_28933/g.96369 Transcript_28933/m.96369 type:complete len:254 (+) Transcript_28933:3254-4015(+)
MAVILCRCFFFQHIASTRSQARIMCSAKSQRLSLGCKYSLRPTGKFTSLLRGSKIISTSSTMDTAVLKTSRQPFATTAAPALEASLRSRWEAFEASSVAVACVRARIVYSTNFSKRAFKAFGCESVTPHNFRAYSSLLCVSVSTSTLRVHSKVNTGVETTQANLLRRTSRDMSSSWGGTSTTTLLSTGLRIFGSRVNSKQSRGVMTWLLPKPMIICRTTDSEWAALETNFLMHSTCLSRSSMEAENSKAKYKG